MDHRITDESKKSKVNPDQSKDGRQGSSTLRIVFGWLCIIGGVFGLFLPFLQGFLLIFVGLGLLSKTYPILLKIRCVIERRLGSKLRASLVPKRKREIFRELTDQDGVICSEESAKQDAAADVEKVTR